MDISHKLQTAFYRLADFPDGQTERVVIGDTEEVVSQFSKGGPQTVLNFTNGRRLGCNTTNLRRIALATGSMDTERWHGRTVDLCAGKSDQGRDMLLLTVVPLPAPPSPPASTPASPSPKSRPEEECADEPPF
jgi:hypothetical protein